MGGFNDVTAGGPRPECRQPTPSATLYWDVLPSFQYIPGLDSLSHENQIKLGSRSRCKKPQVLSPDAVPANPSVSVLAENMLERGWITRDEHAQLLLGDRYNTTKTRRDEMR